MIQFRKPYEKKNAEYWKRLSEKMKKKKAD